MDLGGVAGASDTPQGGLGRFKAGFANRTVNAPFAGSILDPELYRELCAARRDAPSGDFFPAYRAPPCIPENPDEHSRQ